MTSPSITEELAEAITKIRDTYKRQMQFCDIEPLGYYREFVRKLDAALSRYEASKQKGTTDVQS